MVSINEKRQGNLDALKLIKNKSNLHNFMNAAKSDINGYVSNQTVLLLLNDIESYIDMYIMKVYDGSTIKKQ